MSTNPETPPKSSPPSPDNKKKMTEAEFYAQVAKSAGNMGANSPVTPDSWRGRKRKEES